MDANFSRNDCRDCPARVICHCLQVTEDTLLRALGNGEARTLKDVCQRTGAGDGCTACHRLLRQYLDRAPLAAQPSSSPSPI